MRWLKLTLAYDGTAYAGWQLQPDKPTVQSALERTLQKITGETIRVAGSSRTDSGVHALGQVVSFQTESQLSPEILQKALNAELPEDLFVVALAEAPAGFHAIRDAFRKRYRYQLYDGRARDVFRRRYHWHVYRDLDAPAMHRAAQALVGTHDFRSFQTTSDPQPLTSIRTIFELFVRRGGAGDDASKEDPNKERLITLEVEANGFLYNMVRTIVGTLVKVGRGEEPESWPAEVLAALDRRRAGPTAPSHGLFLLKVDCASE